MNEYIKNEYMIECPGRLIEASTMTQKDAHAVPPVLGSSYSYTADNYSASGCFVIQADVHIYRSILNNGVIPDESTASGENVPNGEDGLVYQKQGVRVHGGEQNVCMRRGEGEESTKSRQQHQATMPYLVVLRYEPIDDEDNDDDDDDDDDVRHHAEYSKQINLESSSDRSYRMVVDIHVCTVVSVTRNETNATDSYLIMWSQTRFVDGLRQMLNLDVDLESMEPERVIPMSSSSDDGQRRRFVANMLMRRMGKDPEQEAAMNCTNDATGRMLRGDGTEANEGKETIGACAVEHRRGWISYAGIALSLATVMANVVLEWRSRRQRQMIRLNDNKDENEQGSETNAEWQRTKMGRLKRGGSSMQMTHAHKSVQPWQ